MIFLKIFNINIKFLIFLVLDISSLLYYLVFSLNKKYSISLLLDLNIFYFQQHKIYIFSWKNKYMDKYIKNIILSFFSLFFKYSLYIELLGLGFRFVYSENYIYFILGFSHLIKLKIFNLSDLINCITEKKFLLIHHNKYILGNILGIIKSFKTFNIYKGKGVKNIYKKIRLKLIKTKVINK